MQVGKLTEKSLAAIAVPTDAPQLYVWDEGDGAVEGFGVCIGRTGARSFVFRGRVDGKRVKVTIGREGAPREDGRVWNVALARQRASTLRGDMAKGENPNATAVGEGDDAADGPTLRDGMQAHAARMRKRGRSDRSIATFEGELSRYCADWLDRPIAELTGATLVELHERIKRDAKPRAGSNPANAKGSFVANRVTMHVSAAWNSLNKLHEGALGSWNPAKAVDRDTLKPKREVIEDLPGYAKRVETMRNPVQRDGLMVALYTGLRHEDVRSIRWEDVDFDAATLHLPDPKGGEARAFTIPLSATPLAILKRRLDENAKILMIAERGGDHGFAFPSLSADLARVIAISDLRQQVHEGDTHTRFPAEQVHALRRTWESIAHEEGVSELDIHVLSNHSFASHNVNATYIRQHIDHLTTVAAKIDAAITRRIETPKDGATKPTTKRAARGGAKLRSVA